MLEFAYSFLGYTLYASIDKQYARDCVLGLTDQSLDDYIEEVIRKDLSQNYYSSFDADAIENQLMKGDNE